MIFFEGIDSSPVDRVDASALVNADASERLSISKILWTISGAGTLKVSWEGTPDKIAILLNGGGKLNFVGFTLPNDASTPTGDILISKENFAGDDTYQIYLYLKKVSGYGV